MSIFCRAVNALCYDRNCVFQSGCRVTSQVGAHVMSRGECSVLRSKLCRRAVDALCYKRNYVFQSECRVTSQVEPHISSYAVFTI